MKQSFLGLPATDPWRNSVLCLYLENCYNGRSRDSYVIGDGPLESDDVVTNYPSSLTRCACTVISWPFGRLFLFGGLTASNQSLIIQLRNDWANVPNWSNLGFSPIVGSALQSTLDDIPDFSYTDNRPLYIVGHSFGGAVAQVLGVQYRLFNPLNTIQVITYGQFRPGTTVFQTRAAYQQGVRWWNNGDPIRYAPPHADEYTTLTLVNSLPLINGSNAQVQTYYGWRLDDSGYYARDEGEPGPLNTVLLDLVGWLTGPNGFGNTAHTLNAYRDRFLTALQVQVPPPAPVPDPPREPAEHTSHRQLAHLQEQGIGLVEQAVSQGTLPPIAINFQPGTSFTPSPSQPSPPRYKLRKLGRIWGVTFNDQVVAVGPGKRHARSLRTRLNRTLVEAQF